MRREKVKPVLIAILAVLMLSLAACVSPAVDDAGAKSSLDPVPTAEVTLSAYPDPTSTPRFNLDDLKVGDVIWGPEFPDGVAPITGDPAFREELLEDQSHALGYAEQVYNRCVAGVPALAAAASAFPSISTGCRLNTTDPAEITHQLYYSEDGGEIQEKLLAGLEELLTSKGTTLEVVRVSGLVKMPQAYVAEANGKYSILGFRWSEPFLLEDAVQLKVTRLFADGTKEIGYFDPGCRDCLSVPLEEEMVG